MRRKLLILLNIILFIAFAVFAIVITWHIFYGNQAKNTQDANKQELNASPPYAPENSNWEAADPKDPQSITQATLNTYLYSSNSAEISPLPLLGREWNNTQVFETDTELKEATDLTSYFLEQLELDGWRYVIESDGEIFRGVAADGPLGNVISYLKVENNNLQLFIMSTQRDTNTCPCTSVTRIFITNPIPTKAVLANT